MADTPRAFAEHPLVETITEHVGYFTRMFPVKALLASALAIISDVWGWERVVFIWYCTFALIDLFLVNAQAFIFGTWTAGLTRMWMSKVFFELFVIVMVSGIFHSLFAITGQLLTIANWMFLLCMLTYLSSILDRLHTMGAPLPAFLGPVLRAVRRRVSVNLSTLLADAEVARNLERALAGDKAVKNDEDDIALQTPAGEGEPPPRGHRGHHRPGDDDSQKAA